jgi:hypothetical protein
MARWPVTVAGEERREEEEERNTLTRCPGACLGGMAGQCPRGRPGATWGSLHRGSTGSTRPWMLPPACTRTATTSVSHNKHQERTSETLGSEATGAGRTRVGTSHGSPRRESGRRIQLEEGVEDTEAQRLPQVAVAEFAGGGQECRAMAAAIRVHQSNSGKRGVRERGWTGSVWPTQTWAGWVQPARWAGLGQWAKAQL